MMPTEMVMTESLGRDYRIRYKVLKPQEVSDITLVHPSEGGIIFRAGSVRFGTKYKERTFKEPYFVEVERSVLDEGFQNPVCCMSIKEGVFAYYGTTRLAVAHKNDLHVPCIIGDYVDRFTDAEELFTLEDIIDKHRDVPKGIVLAPDRMNIWGCA